MGKPVAAEINDERRAKFGAEEFWLRLKVQNVGERLGTPEYVGASPPSESGGLLDGAGQMVDFDLPPSLLDAEASGQIAHRAVAMRTTLDVKATSHPESRPRTEHKKLAARRRASGSCCWQSWVRTPKCSVTDAEMTQAIMNAAVSTTGQDAPVSLSLLQNQTNTMQAADGAPRSFEDKLWIMCSHRATVNPTRSLQGRSLQKAIEALGRRVKALASVDMRRDAIGWPFCVAG